MRVKEFLKTQDKKVLVQVNGRIIDENEHIPDMFIKVVKVPGKLINFVTENHNENH